MSTFVLNVTTGHEEYSVNLLRSIAPFKPFYSRIWVPSKVRNYHNSLKDQAKGLPEYSLLQEPLFPGYAFVEAKEYGALLQAIRDLYIYSYIDLLGTKTGDQMELRTVLPEEQGWVDKLSSDQPTKAVFAEGRIRFVEGPLVGMESFIKSVDRRKGNVGLAMPFPWFSRLIWLAYCS